MGISTHIRKPPFSFFHPFYAVCCWGCDFTWFENGITSLVVGHIEYSYCTGGVWSRVFRARLAVYLEYIPEEVGISTHTQVSVVFLLFPPLSCLLLRGVVSRGLSIELPMLDGVFVIEGISQISPFISHISPRRWVYLLIHASVRSASSFTPFCTDCSWRVGFTWFDYLPLFQGDFFLFTGSLFPVCIASIFAFSHVLVSASFCFHCCILPGRLRFLYYAQCSSSYDVSIRYCGCARVRVEQYHIIQ